MSLRSALATLIVPVVAVGCADLALNGTSEPTLPTQGSTTVGDPTLDALSASCLDGTFTACDELWQLAPIGSEYERLGASCSHRIDITDDAPFGDCVARFSDQITTSSGVTSGTGTFPTRNEFRVNPAYNTWTVILDSVAEDEIERAVDYAEQLKEFDIAAAVFLSTDYPSLNEGFWVVYTGEFADPDSASALCTELQSRGIDCYYRFVGDEPTE